MVLLYKWLLSCCCCCFQHWIPSWKACCQVMFINLWNVISLIEICVYFFPLSFYISYTINSSQLNISLTAKTMVRFTNDDDDFIYHTQLIQVNITLSRIYLQQPKPWQEFSKTNWTNLSKTMTSLCFVYVLARRSARSLASVLNWKLRKFWWGKEIQSPC